MFSNRLFLISWNFVVAFIKIPGWIRKLKRTDRVWNSKPKEGNE